MIPPSLRRRLRGNAAVWQLVEAAAGGVPLHACIISGASGTGKKTAARLLAQALVCTTAGETRPCGVCAACRKAEKDIHPDIITLYRDNKTGYSVDAVRAARQALYIMPNEAARKVYIFADGDFLLPAAQNAMLKMLEEPPAYALIILLCEDPASLLETVRSRCTEVRTERLPDSELRALLAERVDASPEEIDAAIRSAAGSAGAATAFLAGVPETERIAADCCAALAAADEAALYTAYFAAERLSRDELEAVFGMVAAVVGDALALRSGAQTPALPQFSEVAQRLRAAFSPERLKRIYDQARKAYDHTALYLTPGNLLAATVAELFGAVTARLK